jgi:hypothetical protein
MYTSSIPNIPLVASEGVLTDPADATLVADTGAYVRGPLVEIRIVIGASAVCTVSLQRRNAANNANVGAVTRLYLGAGQSAEYVVPYMLADGERVRVVMSGGLTGNIQGTIYATNIRV